MSVKPRLLITISTFFPAKNGGGPVVSLLNLSKVLKDTHDVYFITDHHDFGSSTPYSGVPVGWWKTDDYSVYYIPCGANTRKHIQVVIDEIRPNFIYMNSIFDYHYSIPVLTNKYRKNNKVPLIISSRGELCQGAFNLKIYKKLPYIMAMKMLGIFDGVLWHATSNDEMAGIIKYSGANEEDIYIIENIPSTFSNETLIKEKKNRSLRLVFASRIQKKKNLYGAIKMLNKVKGVEVLFDIYGPMEDEDYWSQCMELISQSPHNIKIKYCGMVEHKDIGDTLKKYHAYYMPTFSENYGHAIVEAMLCGCPVIISDQTPWSGINKAEAGYAIPLNNEEEFVNAIKEIALMDQEKYNRLLMNNLSFVKLNIDVDSTVKEYKKMFSYSYC